MQQCVRRVLMIDTRDTLMPDKICTPSWALEAINTAKPGHAQSVGLVNQKEQTVP